MKNTHYRFLSSDHNFNLWFWGQLLDEAVRLDNMNRFNSIVENNPELKNEYFERQMKK